MQTTQGIDTYEETSLKALSAKILSKLLVSGTRRALQHYTTSIQDLPKCDVLHNAKELKGKIYMIL